MIRLSNGVEISEDTVVSALKKAGICVEPNHVFRAGDVVSVFDTREPGDWRLIFACLGKLYSVNQRGMKQGDGTQKYFENNYYKYVGRQEDLLKSN